MFFASLGHSHTDIPRAWHDLDIPRPPLITRIPQGVTLQGCSDPNVRVYALSTFEGQELRVVLVKKNGTSAATVTVNIAGEASMVAGYTCCKTVVSAVIAFRGARP